MRTFIIFAQALALLAVLAAGVACYRVSQAGLEIVAVAQRLDARMDALDTQQKELHTLALIASRDSSEAVSAAKREDPALETLRSRIRNVEAAIMAAPAAGGNCESLAASLAITDRALDDVRRRLGDLETK